MVNSDDYDMHRVDGMSHQNDPHMVDPYGYSPESYNRKFFEPKGATTLSLFSSTATAILLICSTLLF